MYENLEKNKKFALSTEKEQKRYLEQLRKEKEIRNNKIQKYLD